MSKPESEGNNLGACLLVIVFLVIVWGILFYLFNKFMPPFWWM